MKSYKCHIIGGVGSGEFYREAETHEEAALSLGKYIFNSGCNADIIIVDVKHQNNPSRKFKVKRYYIYKATQID